MTEQNVVSHRDEGQDKRQPSCNVSQKFNFTVGALALLAAAAIVLVLAH